MRKLYVISAVCFVVIGIAFTILPLSAIAFIPIVIALILAFLAIHTSKVNQKELPKLILFISALLLLVAIGKVVFVKDVVAPNTPFELNKVDPQKKN